MSALIRASLPCAESTKVKDGLRTKFAGTLDGWHPAPTRKQLTVGFVQHPPIIVELIVSGATVSSTETLIPNAIRPVVVAAQVPACTFSEIIKVEVKPSPEMMLSVRVL